MPDGGLRRVGILSAIRIEYQAVCAHLTNLRQEIRQSGTIYERGNFTANSQSWDVLIGETGIGNTRAAVETVSLIEYFKPSLILFVGVAGGLKDVKLGDVVAATKVYGYESGKAGRKFRPRPDVHNSTYRMEQIARAEARRRDWFQRLEKAFLDPASVPHVYVAPIASGNQVAASMDSVLGNLLRSNYSDAVAVEMEGYGFLGALHAYPYIDALIIRGISDRIDDKTEADAMSYQEVAAQHAAAFAFEILAKLDLRVPQQSEQATETSATTKEEKIDEVPQHEATIVDELQASSPEDITIELLREFHAALPVYTGIIENIRVFLDEGRGISPAWCKSVIKRLDNIDEHVQKLRKDAPGLSLFDRVILVNIHDQISTLKSELQAFRHPRWFSSVPSRKQVDEGAYERIRTICKTLLTDLGQFNRS
jgi:nucleoside phosphorylase